MDNSLPLIIALVIVIITTVIFFLYRKTKSTHRDVMIAGISGSGKTLLFSLLVHDKYVQTHTSAKENFAPYDTEKGSLNIVDIPGYERLREKYVEQYKKSSKALIYVIDSVTFQRDIRDVAEYLFVIMTDPTVASNCKNYLIFCNKQDCPTAKGSEVIRSQLEKEMNLLRNTKANKLRSTDGSSDNSTVFLGSRDSDFAFSQMTSKVEFAEGYAYSPDMDPPSNFESINNWLDKIC